MTAVAALTRVPPEQDSRSIDLTQTDLAQAAPEQADPRYVDAATELRRMRELVRSRLLDRRADPALEAIAALAAQVCGTTMAAVNIVDADTVFARAQVGLPTTDVPREVSFCSIGVATGAALAIGDLTIDRRTAGNPLITLAAMRAYAGAVLHGQGGAALGTVCVYDAAPRRWSAEQTHHLGLLSAVAAEIVAGRSTRGLSVALDR